jgi:polyisoprenoid-binding protein YceI
MTLINRLLIALFFISLLVTGFFAFGENGFLNNSREKAAKTSTENADDLNNVPESTKKDPVYIIDKNNSHLAVRLFKAGIASAFAHDHVVRANDFSGWVVFKKDHPDGFKMEVEVPSASLIADSQKDREKYKLGNLDEDDRNEVNETMKSSSQLHVEKYPKILFSSSKLENTDKNNYTLTGDFTLHGTTKEIAVPVTITFEKNALNIKGEFRFLQSDYGIEPFRAGWGTIRNKDEVLLLLDLRATEKK